VRRTADREALAPGRPTVMTDYVYDVPFKFSGRIHKVTIDLT
jgi:hypothetical protein